MHIQNVIVTNTSGEVLEVNSFVVEDDDHDMEEVFDSFIEMIKTYCFNFEDFTPEQIELCKRSRYVEFGERVVSIVKSNRG